MVSRRTIDRWKTLLVLGLLGSLLFSVIALVGRSKKLSGPVARNDLRALFVWDTTIPGDPAATGELLGLAREKGVNLFFLDSSPVVSDASNHAAYEEFVAWCHAAEVRVFALGGFPWWSVPDDAGIAGQLSGHGEGWAYYEAIVASGIPFDGVADDTEAYLANTSDWWARPAVRAQQYLDWLDGVRVRTAGLPLFAAIPFWYDVQPLASLSLRGERTPRALNTYVADTVDTVLVMSYRDTALGPDGMIEHARGEVEAGPVLLGAETTYLGDDPVSNKVTFWEEGERHMERQLALTRRAFRGDSHLRGFFVHDSRGLSALRP